ncbi:MAG TPA: glycosyltransferase [Gaiellaceae bacterium]|nr:glycosyltransferase [Gaiellaceae bacterium]
MPAAAPEPARLRVVQFVPSLWHGGAELVASSLSLALRDRVERLAIASSGGEPHGERLRAAGIPLEIVPRPWARPLPLFRSARALARFLRRERPHVVHAHNPGASAAAALARLLARLPELAIVATYHGVPTARVGRAMRAFALSSDLVVGVTPSATRALVDGGLPRARAATIFNAVDVEPRRPASEVRADFGVPDGVPLVVSVGRYMEEKNQALLVDALARLQRPVRTLLVGYGPLRDTLHEQIVASGLDGECVLTGERSDVPDLIAAADVFVLSSDREALPLVVLEAMSLGTPVVSTAVGGVPDVIADGSSGLLVPIGDAAALAAAIGRLLDEPELAERVATTGKTFVDEHCSFPAMVAAYLEVYRDAIERRAGRRPST